jgi:hypothetical protein
MLTLTSTPVQIYQIPFESDCLRMQIVVSLTASLAVLGA